MSETIELDENTIIGNPVVAENSVKFKANSHGNILFCEDGTDLRGSTITFNGDNALVYLSKNRHQYKLSVSMNRDNTLYIGKDNYFNGKLNLILSERKHIVIGDDGLFSFGIWLRTADPHLIYDCETHERINPSKNILIGDHVWIGQGSLVLKGSTISSGSIIGANSTVSGKLSRQTKAGQEPRPRKLQRTYSSMARAFIIGPKRKRKHRSALPRTSGFSRQTKRSATLPLTAFSKSSTRFNSPKIGSTIYRTAQSSCKEDTASQILIPEKISVLKPIPNVLTFSQDY